MSHTIYTKIQKQLFFWQLHTSRHFPSWMTSSILKWFWQTKNLVGFIWYKVMVFAHEHLFLLSLPQIYIWYPTFVFCGSNAALPLRKLLLLQSIDQYWRWTSYKHKKKWQWNVTWNRTFSFSCHENMIENKHLSWISGTVSECL